MKKFLCVFLLIVIFTMSTVFASSTSITNDNCDDEVFKAILFEYKALTGNDDETCQKYYELLNSENESNINLSINSMTKEELQNKILTIQDNYDKIINDSNKEKIDKYILQLALKYYNYSDNKELLLSRYNLNEKINKLKTLDKGDANVNSNYDSVAVLYVCSDPSSEYGSSSTGLQSAFGHHSWLVITNVTSSPIYVGGLSIPAGETYSFGTWHGNLHNGVYYNTEGFYYDEFGSTSKYYGRTIDQYELNLITYAVSSPEYDKWYATYNCSSFAQDIWNISAPSNKQVSAGLVNNPKTLANSISSIGGVSGKKIPVNKPRYYGGAVPIYIGG